MTINLCVRIAKGVGQCLEWSCNIYTHTHTNMHTHTCAVCVSPPLHTHAQHEYVMSYKQARRREDDIAIVNAGFRMVLTPPGESDWTVQECCLSYGGMSYKTTVAKKTQEYLIGK